MSDSAYETIVQAWLKFVSGEPVDWADLANAIQALANEQKRMTEERDEEVRIQTRLLREIVELLARPDGLGGKRAVQRVRRRVRTQTKTD